MFLGNARNQPSLANTFSFDGTITAGGTSQLLLPQQPSRAYLSIQNISAGNLSIGIGPATATATVTNGAVASVAVNNGGVGYTSVPKVIFFGGTIVGDYQTCPNPQQAAGNAPATAVAALSGTAVNTVTVLTGGAGYLTAPYVFFSNGLPDLGGGAFSPSATAGLLLTPGSSFTMEATICLPDAVAIWGATTGQAFVCKVAF